MNDADDVADTAEAAAGPRWRNDAGLAGNSVLVTGAAGGIGRAVAAALAEAGAVVVAVDRPGSGVGELPAGLAGAGHVPVEVDLSDPETHGVLMDNAVAAAPAGGKLAALVHLAAVLRRRDTVDDVTEEDWDAQADLNLRATFFLNRAAWRCLRTQGLGGSIVNYASQGWWTGGFGGSVAYAATKGGIVSMTRGLARSFAPDGVRVNAVAPGGVDTDMYHDGLDERADQAFIDQVPLGRLASPEEMTGPTLFLASDASRYVTGTVLNVSGGQLAY